MIGKHVTRDVTTVNIRNWVQNGPVMLNTAGEAGEAGDVFSRPSYDSLAAGGDTTRSGLRPITGHC